MTIQEIRDLKKVLETELTEIIQQFEKDTDTVVFVVNTFKRETGTEVSVSLKIGD